MKNSEWQEIRLDSFLDIYKLYQKNEKLNEKILELAGLSEFKLTGHNSSLFLGHSIDVFKDFTDFNKTIINALKNTGDLYKDNYIIASCTISGSESTGPMITPVLGKDHDELLLWSWLDGKMTEDIKEQVRKMKDFQNKQRPLQFWHFKEPEGKKRYISYIDGLRESFERTHPEFQKYVYVRVIDHEYFEKIVDEYLDNGGKLSKETLGTNYPTKRSITLIEED